MTGSRRTRTCVANLDDGRACGAKGVAVDATRGGPDCADHRCQAVIDVETLDWTGCYDDSWRGIITDDSFAHPAKYARGLIDRIIAHGLDRGWWAPGCVIGDPFGGVGTGGIACSLAGLWWVGVELEPRFVSMAQANFKLNHRPMFPGDHPEPRIIQGDSRNFAELVAAGGIVTSPPYGDLGGGGPDYAPDRLQGSGRSVKLNRDSYGSTPGQIGQLRSGEVAAVITSPPFGEDQPVTSQSALGRGIQGAGKRDGQMQSPGNVAALPLNGVVTSPPFARSTQANANDKISGGPARWAGGTDSGARCKNDYAPLDAPGNLAQTEGETYWLAMDRVYRQCCLALRPGGYMAVVIKDYVKKGQRVRLCDQTLTLLAQVGLKPVHRIRAHLVQTICEGGRQRTIERKSFFRRIAEAKGSPRIDWEEVLIVRKTEASL